MVYPYAKRYVFLLSVILIIVMIPFFVFNLMNKADMLGSTGIGFILLLLISYLPQLIRKGYVEKL